MKPVVSVCLAAVEQVHEWYADRVLEFLALLFEQTCGGKRKPIVGQISKEPG